MMLFALLFATLLATKAAANDRGWKSYHDPCPESCSFSSDPFEWNVYSSAARLANCNQTMLMDLTIHNPLDDPNTRSPIYACSVPHNISIADAASASTCEDGFEQTPVILHMGSSGSADSGISNAESQMLDIIHSTKTYLASSAERAGSSIFATSPIAAAGLYVGGRLHNVGAADSIQSAFHKHLRQGLGRQMVLQHCGTTAKDTLGVAINMDGDLAAVQQLVQTWSRGGCASGFERETDIPDSLRRATPVSQQPGALVERSNHCTTVRVGAGDSCHSLAAECGISDVKFTKYNPSPKLCSSLQPGQHVCCSPGSLPDLSPKPNADGTCHSYLVESGDSCSAVAASHSITVAAIEKYNQDTWGWMGCQDFMAGQKICLSSGKPPFPAPISNAVCGPQVPGTTEPTNGTAWRLLNACPLYACCDNWGQCGVDPGFCTKSDSPTGAPGTAASGSRGCVAWCGYELIDDAAAVQNPPHPNWFKRVGYYEGWNLQRPCAKLEPKKISTSYTHVHYAFGTILSDFTVHINPEEETVFKEFVRMTSFKRIVTFGGWSFSTDPSTYMIFRQGVRPANRGKLVQHVVDFVNQHNLDGVDFDWEYPGAPDIPGIPPGSKDDGAHYLAFLQELRSSLPSDKSISVAIPASYWYLRAFPLMDMISVVDYFVFMTYDLAGTWDLGSKWSQPGCPEGNCLRSDVNLTQTKYDLQMIGKVMSPSSVVVGLTSYGRSFEIETPGCTGESCHYVGPGAPGPCTQKKGFLSNFEINEILHNKNKYPTAHHKFSADSDTDILVYNEKQWVGYLSKTTKSTRKFYYERLGFRGTADWAIDLENTWGSLDCNTKAVTDIWMPKWKIWSDLKCEHAWADAIRNWEQHKERSTNHGLQFSEVMAHYFKGPKDIRCGNLADANACGGDTAGGLKCDEFNSPAGYEIIQSFMLLETKYLDMYSNIPNSGGHVTDRTSSLCDTFAPESSGKTMKLVLDLLSLGLSLFLSPCWNKIWKDAAKQGGLENELAVAKDWVNPAISQSITIAKDMSKSGVSLVVGDQNAVQTAIGQITQQWQEGLTQTVHDLFNGSSHSNAQLYHLIKDGRALSQGPLFTNDEWKRLFDTALFTILIPELWTLGQYAPFLMDTKLDCHNGQPPLHSSIWEADWLGATGVPPWYCYQDRLYLLGTPIESGYSRGWYLSTFTDLPGVDKLNGQAWGQISKDDLMLSCLRAYTANGEQNGWARADPQDPTTLDAIIQHGTAAAGVWPFPVCGMAEAGRNWRMWKETGQMSKNYPCN